MKIFNYIERHLEEALMLILFLVMIVSISIQVFMRQIMGDSLPWSEELARYCFVWMIFIGISYAVKVERHIKIDILYLRFSEKGKKINTLFTSVVFLIFVAFLIVQGVTLTGNIASMNASSPALQIPTWILYLALPFGFILTFIRIIQKILFDFKNRSNYSQE